MPWISPCSQTFALGGHLLDAWSIGIRRWGDSTNPTETPHSWHLSASNRREKQITYYTSDAHKDINNELKKNTEP